MITARQRVYFAYWRRGGVWHYMFSVSNSTSLGPERKTRSADILRGMAERGGDLTNLEAKLMFEYGITEGHGGLNLFLTTEQFTKLLQ